jgi:hypothetical protein
MTQNKMVQPGTRRHEEEKKVKRNDCRKKEDTGIFHPLTGIKWT